MVERRSAPPRIRLVDHVVVQQAGGVDHLRDLCHQQLSISALLLLLGRAALAFQMCSCFGQHRVGHQQEQRWPKHLALCTQLEKVGCSLAQNGHVVSDARAEVLRQDVQLGLDELERVQVRRISGAALGMAIVQRGGGGQKERFAEISREGLVGFAAMKPMTTADAPARDLEERSGSHGRNGLKIKPLMRFSSIDPVSSSRLFQASKRARVSPSSVSSMVPGAPRSKRNRNQTIAHQSRRGAQPQARLVLVSKFPFPLAAAAMG